MNGILTMQPYVEAGEGAALHINRETVGYEVFGLGSGQCAWIATFDNYWQILRSAQGIQGEWYGNYATAEDALSHLQEDLTRDEMNLEEFIKVALEGGFRSIRRESDTVNVRPLQTFSGLSPALGFPGSSAVVTYTIEGSRVRVRKLSQVHWYTLI